MLMNTRHLGYLILLGYSHIVLGQQMQALKEPLLVSKSSPLTRSVSAPDMNAVFVRSGSHDMFVLDLHNPRRTSVSSPTSSDSSLQIPVVIENRAKQSRCHRSLRQFYTTKTLSLGVTIGILIAFCYVVNQLLDAGHQLHDGAGEIRVELNNVKGDVQTVKGALEDAVTMCGILLRTCLPCLPKPE